MQYSLLAAAAPDRVLNLVYALRSGLDSVGLALAITCWVMLVIGAAVWIWLRPKGGSLAAVYWLTCGLSLWVMLIVPLPGEGVYALPAFQLCLAVVTLAACAADGIRVRRRRARAVPDHLEYLLERPVQRASLQTSVLVGGLLQLFLSLVFLNFVTSAVALLITAVGMLILAARDYREDLVIAAFSQITTAVVSAAVVLSHVSEVVNVLNVCIGSLAVMAFVWSWFGPFWSQQLIDGRPFTPTGRMIGATLHMRALCVGVALAVAVQFAAWPALPGGFDNEGASALQLVSGTAVLLVLLVVTISITGRGHSHYFGYFSVLAAGTLVVFWLTRIDRAIMQLWVEPHWEFLLSLASPVAYAVRVPLRRYVSRVYERCLTTTALLFIPAVIMIWTVLFVTDVASHFKSRADLLPLAASLGVLGVTYAAAALVRGSYRAVAAAVVLVAMTVGSYLAGVSTSGVVLAAGASIATVVCLAVLVVLVRKVRASRVGSSVSGVQG